MADLETRVDCRYFCLGSLPYQYSSKEKEAKVSLEPYNTFFKIINISLSALVLGYLVNNSVAFMANELADFLTR